MARRLMVGFTAGVAVTFQSVDDTRHATGAVDQSVGQLLHVELSPWGLRQLDQGIVGEQAHAVRGTQVSVEGAHEEGVSAQQRTPSALVLQR